MRKITKLVAIAAIPVAVVGWALFRPELLLVNKSVNEQLSSKTGMEALTLSSGKFSGYAHETTGIVRVVSLDGKKYIQLKDFKTSNGPDVRLLLVPGKDSSQSAVKEAKYLDVGTLKGNEGNQNYEIPADTDLGKYQAVSIWCARFAVAFGGATLEADAKQSGKAQALSSTTTMFDLQGRGYARLAGFGSPIEVTFGKAQGDKLFAGRAAIIEDAGKRFLDLNFTKAMPLEIRLVKKESLSVGVFPKGIDFAALGKLSVGKQRISISKELDAWLYRSVAFVDPATNTIKSFVNLRSAQEKKTELSLV